MNPSPEGAAQGWRIAKISDFAKTTSGGTPSRANPEFYTGNIPWIKSGDLNDGNVSEATEFITEEALKNSSAKLFPAGTLMIALYGATIGKLGILTIDAATNQAVCGIFVPEGVETKYLFYFLLQHRPELIKQGAGGAQPNISQGIIRDIEVPPPPPPEQRRIVARIEELFSSLDAGVAALRHAKAQLQHYRQSVLAAAVTGQLTQAWREQHPDTQPAAKLLESIFSERRENWRGRGKYEVPAKPEGAFDELPASWEPITFGHICQVQGGFAFKSNDFVSEGINLVKIASLRAGKVDLDHNPTYLPADYLTEYSRFALRKGDTLIALSGATTGKMGVYESNDPALLNQRVGRFLPYTETNVTAGYLSLLVAQIGDRVLKQAYGAAQPNISPTEIEEMPFPLPPLAEQHQIVVEVEARTSAIDHLQVDLETQISRSVKLRQSILSYAFSGRIVPQNPDDESTELLLKRIEIEKKQSIRVVDPSPVAKVAPLKKMKKDDQLVSLEELKPDFLASMMKELNKNPISPDALWKESGLSIDLFYAALKREIEAGTVRETEYRKLKLVS
jgi:type I restriction enzyme S subunit